MTEETKSITLSVVTPAFNEQDNLPALYRELSKVLTELETEWEWIIVDDHSRDNTAQVIEDIIKQDNHVKTIRFSRNFGSHPAIFAGLNYCTGDAAVVMASDMQDPPALISELLAKWKQGKKVVWAARDQRKSESLWTKFTSRIYYMLLGSISDMRDTPSKGADMWLMDRQVIDALISDPERHSSVTALIRWMGFDQDVIFYNKQPRLHGKSKWSLRKKIDHAINTFVASSAYPIRYMTYAGLFTAACGFLFAVYVLIDFFFFGNEAVGWPSLMIAILVIGGMQMLMLGVLGEYLWRTYEESRQRPRFIIERELNLKRDESDE